MSSSPKMGATVDCVGVVHVFRVAGTDVAALRGVDLHVDAGEHVALLGPSGSGKSTLLSVVAGLRRPSAGAVLIDGADIARASERRLYDYRAATVGLMLQGAASNLLPYTTPSENVAFATGRSGADNPVLRAAGLHTERRRVAELDRAAQQATALAVAMAPEPRLLLVDEPTSQLDDQARDDLLDAMADVTRSAGTTVLMVTHDEEVAGRLERSVRMRAGRVGAEGERHDQYAVVGADGSIQLPEELLVTWPAGSRLEIRAVSDTRAYLELRIDGSGA
ncbi:MAG TPA: ATP-binding cassette domain-containing protein [Friedmanniella sp.]